MAHLEKKIRKWWQTHPHTLLILVLCGAGIAFTWPFDVPLFDWDEINFAEAAREMLITQNYHQVQINFKPFFEKPPLFFWLQAGCMHLFGINAFSARLPNAICGVLTLLTLYCIGKKYKNKTFALTWVLCHFIAFLPFFYFKSGIMDPVFNLLMLLGVYCFYQSMTPVKYHVQIRYALCSGLWLGAAILTKGPVGGLLPGLVFLSYGIWQRHWPSWRCIGRCFLGIVLVPGTWLAYEYIQHGPIFLQQCMAYHLDLLLTPVAGHAQPIYYPVLVLCLGCFPASVLALCVLVRRETWSCQKHPIFTGMYCIFQCMLVVVIVLFSLVKTKIIHYSSWAYFPITFFAAIAMDAPALSPKKLALWNKWLFGMIGGMFTLIFMILPWNMHYKTHWWHLIKNLEVLAILQTPVKWSLKTVVLGGIYGGVMLMSYYLYRKKYFCIFLSFYSLWLGLFFNTYIVTVARKVAAHVQGPAIQYYQQLAQQSVYVTTLYFHSYAPYFYGQVQPLTAVDKAQKDWLLTGDIDLPAYFVVKVQDMPRMNVYQDIRWCQQNGAYALYYRPVHKLVKPQGN